MQKFFSSFIVFSILFCSWASSGESAILHAIVVCDTQDPTIGFSVKIDYSNIRGEIQKIAYFTGLTLDEKVLHDENVTLDKLLTLLDQLNTSSEDVILFYYSGHGFRTPSKDGNPWPNLFLRSSGKAIDYSLLVQRLIEKNSHLVIAIADCCNNVLPDHIAPPLQALLLAGKIDSQDIKKYGKKNYKKLFSKKNGTVMVASSKEGQFSWGSIKGGVFTQLLMTQLHTELFKKKGPDWHHLLNQISEEVKKKTSKFSVQELEYRVLLN